MSNSYDESLRSSDNTSLITYLLWIVNPRYASADEGSRNAASPSPFSEALSGQFYSLGQEPSVRLAGDEKYENADQLQPTVVYRDDLSIWKVTFEAGKLLRHMGQHLMISGRPISLYECAVGNTMELIRIESSIRYDGGRVQVVNGLPRVGVIMEPCDKKTMLLLTSGGVFVSQDSLLIAQKLALKQFEELQSPVKMSGAVVLLMRFKSVSQHIIIVTDSGIFNIASDEFGTKPLTIRPIVNNAFSKMTGVAASKWMCDLHSPDRQLMPIAFWNATTVVVTNINFTKSTQHSFPTSVIVKDLQYTGQRTTLGVLLFNPVFKKLSVWKLDRIISNRFVEVCSWDANLGAEKYTMTVAPVGITAFYVWNDMAVYYYFGPERFGKLTIFGSPSDPIGSSADPIKQLVITLKTVVAISLNSGALFYSKVMLKEVWKVRMTITATSILSSDETGNMFTVELDSNSQITRSPLDLSYRTVALENTTLKCPFRDFQTSSRDVLNAFRMDLGEEVRVWCLLLLPEGVDDDIIKVDFEALDVVKTKVTNEVHLEESGVSQYKEIQFSIIPEKAKHFTQGNTYMGSLGFQLEPFVDDPGMVVCPTPSIMTGYIYVGCSDFKRLRVRVIMAGDRPDETEPDCDFFKGKPNPYRYSLTGSQIRYPNGSQGTGEKTVEYDYKKLGCPYTVHYTEVLFPKFELVDDLAKTVTPVDGDFVIFEHYNRLFYYNNTAIGVKCSIQPQTWKEMVESSNETEMKYKWTPANYISCHSENNSTQSDIEAQLEHPYEQYQILNDSNIIGLTFKQSGSLGIYVFTAVVVHPNLSFCYLSATFAVNIVGKAVRRDFLGLYITLSTYTVLLVVFVLTMYFYYRDHVYGK